ncbi:MAG TPA: hypothetical protein VLH09_10935, partial [Bryobacteraceae bacterium]|nr:hypothetical protein [Bryobacteraceae bacterium]
TLPDEGAQTPESEGAPQMLRIFEQEESGRHPDKQLLLNRLQEAATPEPSAAREQPSAPVVAERPVAATARPPLKAPERKPVITLPELPAPPAPAAFAPPGATIPPELQPLAEQFTHGFLNMLLSAVRNGQAPVAEDHRKLQAVLGLHEETALEVDALRSDLNAACERIDSLAMTLQETSARARKVEDAVRDAQQELEKRLEVQAEVIRNLHSGLQAREEELDKVLTAFQSLRGTVGERGSRRSLPERL